jgi:hypothetical protein
MFNDRWNRQANYHTVGSAFLMVISCVNQFDHEKNHEGLPLARDEPVLEVISCYNNRG